MAHQPTDSLKVMFFLISLLFTVGSSENDLFLDFCGTWRHGKGPLSLNINLSTGCDKLSISANERTLSINGKITAQCRRNDVISLKKFGLDSEEDSSFCLFWEPLLDQLKLQVGGHSLILCWPASVLDTCCTDLSHGANTAEAKYGIKNGTVRNDVVNDKVHKAYNFGGSLTKCKKLCDQAVQESSYSNTHGEAVKRTQSIEHPCAYRSEVEMKEGFRGSDIKSPTTTGETSEPTTTIHLPPALHQAAKNSNAACTFFHNNSFFQEGPKEVQVLNDVVEITVADEIITDLSEPIRIGFHHNAIPKMHSRKCVSWDTRKDPLQVNWLVDGCVTQQRGPKHTDCLCNHLTYFTVLVQLEPRPVRHLLALTAITSLGCAVSVISCIALIIYLCRKRGRSKEQSIPIHLGLAVSLAFLNLLFFSTGVLANLGGESMCVWVGALLHYALLSSFSWMGIEVFNTFWLVYMVFSPSPKLYTWNIVGFILPAVPVIILAAVGGIYGLREVVPSDDISNPYRMCWMNVTNKAWLAHVCTNITVLALLVSAGFVMLFLVYRQIRTRDEWRQNRVAFLSIWGLSCLFGTTWGLTFLDFGPLSDFILFLSCILNSFQGFLLMLRFCMLDWIQKQGARPGLGSTSTTGSTRQHMLQEKS
ncbi:adhesion G-protein coupled receptor G5-like isoform X1 [Acanthochromis polyacanthus]|uniref:Adhesion G protein-coupled receptor G1 n=1 Tax=Acanthochromis polyacanthus TaxID=80966 RepID=A0A3Q1GGA2_9TELE|nr:adhesion G-protein coupled receptor G5-like isoform X1 [Acanthochromis polyacanthus]